MLTLTYEFKLKPTKKQIKDIEQILTVCRKVWNYALRERKDSIQSHKCRVDVCSLKITPVKYVPIVMHIQPRKH